MSTSADNETAKRPGVEPGPVREEAERLAAAVLARLAAAGVGPDVEQDPARGGRIAHAAGDVAVAVTGLLRELARAPESGEPREGLNLRESFALFASQVVESAGVDLHAPPARDDDQPWQAPGVEDDPWRAATRASQRKQESR